MIRLIKLITPPIIIVGIKKVYNFNNKNILFDGYDDLFKKYVKFAKIYGEYGMGNSKRYVNQNLNIPIKSVDTNNLWMNKVKSELIHNDTYISLKSINVGKIASNYGDPSDYSLRKEFKSYFNAIWDHPKPDFVLIDGRFRVATFLASYIYASPKTVIVFDDYYRGRYHIVEEILSPIEKNNRQAAFIVPENKKMEEANKLLEKFEYVMD